MKKFTVILVCLAIIYPSIVRADVPAVVAGQNQYHIDVQTLKDFDEKDKALFDKYLKLDTPEQNIYISDSSLPEYAAFANPNELRLDLLAQVIQPKTKGSYVAVGTERCLTGGALYKFSRIDCFDYDHGSVLYLLANMELIRISKDLNQYKKFQNVITHFSEYQIWYQNAKHAEKWYDFSLKNENKKVFDDAMAMRVQIREELASLGLNEWQQNAVFRILFVTFKHITNVSKFDISEIPNGTSFLCGFSKYDYKYNQELFASLKEKINQGIIHVHWMDWQNANHIAMLTESINSQHSKIAVIDLSNVIDYVDIPEFQKNIYSAVVSTSSTDVRLVQTAWKPGKRHLDQKLKARFPSKQDLNPAGVPWVYTAMTLDNTSLQSLISQVGFLRPNRIAVLNGEFHDYGDGGKPYQDLRAFYQGPDRQILFSSELPCSGL